MFSGILLILSIIDFSLAAPVLVQENRQAGVDVVHIPKYVITALGKRGPEELQGAMLDFFRTWGKPMDSSGAHAPSSSARPGPDHGSTSVVQAPGPNPASSTANPGLLVVPPSSSSTASSVKGVSGSAQSDGRWPQSHELEGDGEFYDVPLDSPPSSKYGSAHGLTAQWHEPLPKLPNSNPTPPTDSTFGINALHSPQPKPASLKSSTSTKSGFNWKHWINPLNLMNPLVPAARPASSKALNPKPSNPGVWTPPDSHPNLMAASPPLPPLKVGLPKIGEPKEPEDGVVHGPPPTSESPPPSPNLAPLKRPGDEVVPGPPPTSDPELDSDHPSSSAGFQPSELQAAIYAAKGKTKESRRVFGTARDVGNAAQRQLQPAESLHDPEE
jgi:hypothetical protein